jgi:4-amino-4-deoxy-L-arabinose transferase-like glycosyltransferase
MNFIRKPQFWILALIICVFAYWRLWHIDGLFNWTRDYDEGAYSIGGRLIAQGYLPYRDFTLVHPPLYDLVLSSVYKIAGYSFLYGRYLSLAIAIGCLILVYLILKKLLSRTAGLIGAGLFSVFPGFFYLWNRVVQEPLGILFILAAIYTASDFIRDGSHERKLFLSGLFLGLALAAKYTFVPAILGFTVGLGVVGACQQRLKKLLVPLGLLVSGGLIGFFLVTGFFILKSPGAFYSQTIQAQLDYRSVWGLGAFIRKTLVFWTLRPDPWPFRVTVLSLAAPYLAFITLLLIRRFSRSMRFLISALFVTLPLSLLYDPPEPRYFVSAFIFMLLAISVGFSSESVAVVPKKFMPSLVDFVSGVTALLLFVTFTFGSFILTRDYHYLKIPGQTVEGAVYHKAAEYLEQIGAKKVWSLNPVFPALDPKLLSTIEFDTFGLTVLMKQPSETLYESSKAEGADYIIVDTFFWNLSNDPSIGRLVKEIESKAVFIVRVGPGSVTEINGALIYKIPDD